MVLKSFGAPLLAIASPDSNSCFVVGRAPLRAHESETHAQFDKLSFIAQVRARSPALTGMRVDSRGKALNLREGACVMFSRT